MNDKQVNRVKRVVRKMSYWQRIELMDWMNAWYSDYKDQERRENEER